MYDGYWASEKNVLCSMDFSFNPNLTSPGFTKYIYSSHLKLIWMTLYWNNN